MTEGRILHSPVSGHGHVAGFCEHGNEITSVIKCGKFLD
jgi:hypothetical protein